MDDIEKVSAVQEAEPATPPAGVRSSVAANHGSPFSPPLGSPPHRAGCPTTMKTNLP